MCMVPPQSAVRQLYSPTALTLLFRRAPSVQLTRRPQTSRPTCWDAGTGCTTGAWVGVAVRRDTLDEESDPPSELCILGVWTGSRGQYMGSLDWSTKRQASGGMPTRTGPVGGVRGLMGSWEIAAGPS